MREGRKEEWGGKEGAVFLLWNQPAEGVRDLADGPGRQWVVGRQLRWVWGPGDSYFQRHGSDLTGTP